MEGHGDAAAVADTSSLEGYEYLDHTADIQIHSWSPSMKGALQLATVAMFAYMTDLDRVDIDDAMQVEVEARGEDMEEALYHFMDDFLFAFNADDFMVCKEVTVTSFERSPEEVCIKAIGRGESFDIKKHSQGTEIKAITFSAMKIVEESDRVDLFIIVDI